MPVLYSNWQERWNPVDARLTPEGGLVISLLNKTGLAEKLRAVGLVEEVKPKKKAVKKDGRGKS